MLPDSKQKSRHNLANGVGCILNLRYLTEVLCRVDGLWCMDSGVCLALILPHIVILCDNSQSYVRHMPACFVSCLLPKSQLWKET